MPQRRTRAAPYPSLCSTCRRVNYQQFHQGVGILWLHLQIASVQKLRSLLYAVPQVLRFSHLWPHVYSLPDLSYQTLRDRRFQVPRLATCIRPVCRMTVTVTLSKQKMAMHVLTAQSCYRILPPTTLNRLDEDCRNETLQLVEERYNIII